MKMKLFVAAIVACVSLSPVHAGATATLVKTRLAASQAVVPGRWHASLSKAKSYAVKHGVPLIAVWSNGDACPHCVDFETSCTSATFENWMKTSGCVFHFVSSEDSNNDKTFDFCYRTQALYPLIRVYWYKNGKKKLDTYAMGDTVDGARAGTAGGTKAVAWFKNKLKNFKPGPTVVKPYTIKFDPNCTNDMTSCEMPVVETKVGKTITLPANTYIRPDYSFVGWAKTATGAVAYKNKASVKNLTTVSNDVVTLYAKWLRTTFRVTAGVKTTVSITDCKGWAVKSGSVAGMKWSSKTGKWTGTPTVAKTYTVKYTKGSSTKTRKVVVAAGVPYTIAFAPNGATNEMESVDVRYGIARALPANTLGRPDYAFNGWAKTATGAVVYKNKASVKNLSAVSNRIVTLHAKWLRTTYRTYFTGVKTTISIPDCKGWTRKSGTISGMTWSSSAGKWTGAPKAAGTYTIKYAKGSSSKTRKIVVAKDAVVFADEDAARYVDGEGEPLELNLSPSSLAGAAKTVTFTGLPEGLAYDSATGCVTGTPVRVGVFKVTVTVTSVNGQKLSRSFNITIGVPDRCIGTFNGFIGWSDQGSSDPLSLGNRGTFRLSAPSNANLSAKVVTAKGTYVFTGQGWIVNDDGSYTADLATADGKDTLLFTVSGDSVSADFISYGSFSASYGTEYEVWAQRSPFERDESGAYDNSLVADNAEKIIGTWHFAVYPGPAGEWTIGFAEEEDADLTLSVNDDGTATLAGKVGSYDVSVSSATYVFADNVAEGFVRTDFAVPVSVQSDNGAAKKTLDIWLKLWFDRASSHYSVPGEGIGSASLVDFQ